MHPICFQITDEGLVPLSANGSLEMLEARACTALTDKCKADILACGSARGSQSTSALPLPSLLEKLEKNNSCSAILQYSGDSPWYPLYKLTQNRYCRILNTTPGDKKGAWPRPSAEDMLVCAGQHRSIPPHATKKNLCCPGYPKFYCLQILSVRLWFQILFF